MICANISCTVLPGSKRAWVTIAARIAWRRSNRAGRRLRGRWERSRAVIVREARCRAGRQEVRRGNGKYMPAARWPSRRPRGPCESCQAPRTNSTRARNSCRRSLGDHDISAVCPRADRKATHNARLPISQDIRSHGAHVGAHVRWPNVFFTGKLGSSQSSIEMRSPSSSPSLAMFSGVTIPSGYFLLV